MQLEKLVRVENSWQQALIDQSWDLLSVEQRQQADRADYGFIVFPMAKAYEGYVKDWLLAQGLISHQTWSSQRFRLGRSLNPDVSPPQRDHWWLFDDVSRVCGQALARSIWTAWLECRNHVFHYFPDASKAMTLPEAEACLHQLNQTMHEAQECLIQSDHRN